MVFDPMKTTLQRVAPDFEVLVRFRRKVKVSRAREKTQRVTT